ncbi:MAG: type I 3-dehydroquinate dehydratase [Candidatus Heimdallarchaeota archaeon]
MREISSEKRKGIICCLIPSIDFPKAFLLANIAKEEGAGYSEIRTPVSAEIADFKLFPKVKGKIILAIDPDDVREKSLEKQEITKKAETLLESFLLLQPHGIELNYNLNSEFIKKITSTAKEQKITTTIAKYFDQYPKKSEFKNTLLELKEYNCTRIKMVIPLQEGFQALDILSYHKYLKKDRAIIVGAGEEGRIAQLLAPFYGSEYTYGYLSRKIDEALISLSYLNKSIDSIITMR